MSIESLASRVIANEEIRITVEALDDWLVGLLQSIAEAERLGPDESVAKIKKGLSLRTASDELRDITVVVQVTQKPYKVQPAASRPIKVGDRNRGAWNNGHGPEYTDGGAPKEQTTFLQLPGGDTIGLVVPRNGDGSEDD